MIPFDVLSVFFAAAIALGLAPGPDNLFVLTQSALHGRLAGFVVTLGLCTGLIFHSAAVALGVAAVFQTSALAFTVLKLAGAAYLLYLAVQAFRAGADDPENRDVPDLSLLALYRRGIVMNVTNPKVAIFFLAFLPQFSDPARGPVAGQILILGALFICATVLVFGGVALGGGTLGNFLKRSPAAQIWLNRLAGAVFAALAVRLALAER
ncbi:LysE family translocator [Roseibium denhamense]|uniref:Threonine/homoserine/homoserine lactone efflux protein n=1 Tax=Roseibium denhamense TaxID=76305 RepID=A0ABY1NW66_9HYPH|nr:LysE family translocator [Roseibium denhamense]SMP19897.1 Threonine/homoserine/homoserine lactone efflux protein [Roseibium denhamense]